MLEPSRFDYYWALLATWLDNFDPKLIWHYGGIILNYGGGLGLLVVAAMFIRSVPDIIKLFERFKDARQPLWDLRQSVTDLKEQLPQVKNTLDDTLKATPQLQVPAKALQDSVAQLKELKVAERLAQFAMAMDQFATRLNALDATAKTLSEQLKTTQTQLRDLQKHQDATDSVSTDTADPGSFEWDTLDNWGKLSWVWEDFTQRIELLIDQKITDGRTLQRYNRISRRTYRDVIDALLKDGLISTQLGKVLIALNTDYLSWRPRKLQTPTDVAERAGEIWDEYEDQLPDEDDEVGGD